MNWEIEDCLIRLENRMYDCGSERSASNDRYTVEEYIRELVKENKALRVKIKGGDGMRTMTLEGGKYKVVFMSDGRMCALRYGADWRDLTGDKLILALVHRIEELENIAIAQEKQS